MKKVNLLLLMLLIAGFSFGQSFQIINPDTAMWGPVTTTLHGNATIKNISGSTKSVKCKRLIIHLDAGNSNYFCWGITCYPPTIDVSPTPLTMASGDSTLSFSGWCADSALPGVNTVQYTFFDANNTSDSISFIARYYFGPVGINELSAMNTLFDVFPNPADDKTTIQYTVSKEIHQAQLILMNISGSKIAEYPLDTKNNSFIISTKNLSNGIYFYSLLGDGKMIATKRLLVSH